jgi:hypothetical protein
LQIYRGLTIYRIVIQGLDQDLQRSQGPWCKSLGLNRIYELFFIRKTHELSPRGGGLRGTHSMVDRGH